MDQQVPVVSVQLETTVDDPDEDAEFDAVFEPLAARLRAALDTLDGTRDVYDATIVLPPGTAATVAEQVHSVAQKVGDEGATPCRGRSCGQPRLFVCGGTGVRSSDG